MTLITYSCPEPRVSGYFKWKRYIDFPIALLMSVIAVPIVFMAWIAVRLTSPGPGFYQQVRLGRDGKPFTIYKLRSMRADAEAATGAVWAARKDHRVTTVGRILRKTHIDELPQLYNVLKGDMDLVGPRPERPEFVSELEKRIDGYSYRLLVKPGITGLAELNQASDIDLNDVRRKLVYDFDYIEHASFWLEMRLLFCTVLKVLFLCRLPVLKVFGLYRDPRQSSWAPTLLPVSYATPRDEDRLSKIMLKRTTV